MHNNERKMSKDNLKCMLFIYIFLKLIVRQYIQEEVKTMANDNFVNKNIYNTVRMNIKKYRKAAKMTQQELADASGFSHGYIREIESIKMGATFSLDAVEKIANGLKIDFKYLFEENNDN